MLRSQLRGAQAVIDIAHQARSVAQITHRTQNAERLGKTAQNGNECQEIKHNANPIVLSEIGEEVAQGGQLPNDGDEAAYSLR